MTAILLIEDDEAIRRRVAGTLASRGYHVDSASTALGGLERAVKEKPDLVILDLGLPDLDGSELLTMLRAVSTVPVIVATARGDEQEIVAILDAGADDYLVKPFSPEQLEARVRAVLRRGTTGEGDERVIVGGLTIDPAAREVTLEGTPIDLSPKEFDLLLHLARHQGAVVSRRDIQAEVWREPYGGSEKTVDVHLSTLRKKLGESAAEPRYLRSVHGVGVKLVDPGS